MRYSLKLLLSISVFTLPSVFGSAHDLSDTDHAPAAAVSITRVSTTSDSKAPKNNFGMLNPDGLDVIIGRCRTDNPNMIEVGFLTPQDLAVLARTSKALAADAQTILQKLKGFIISQVTPIVRRPALTEAETRMMQLLGVKFAVMIKDFSCIASLDWDAYSRAADKFKSLNIPDEAIKLYELCANHPNTSPYYIHLAAEKISDLGDEVKAKDLFVRGAEHPNATAENILTAAEEILELGDKVKAKDLYERSAQHPNATPYDIHRAAEGILKLGDEGAANSLYVRGAEHPNATSRDLLRAAEGILELGDEVKAKDLFVRGAEHPNATPYEIIITAKHISELGDKVKAKDLYVRSANHPNATAEDIRRAKEEILKIANK